MEFRISGPDSENASKSGDGTQIQYAVGLTGSPDLCHSASNENYASPPNGPNTKGLYHPKHPTWPRLLGPSCKVCIEPGAHRLGPSGRSQTEQLNVPGDHWIGDLSSNHRQMHQGPESMCQQLDHLQDGDSKRSKLIQISTGLHPPLSGPLLWPEEIVHPTR